MTLVSDRFQLKIIIEDQMIKLLQDSLSDEPELGNTIVVSADMVDSLIADLKKAENDILNEQNK